MPKTASKKTKKKANKIEGKSKKTPETAVERVQNKNLTPGGPGRPKGQRNYATIYREALVKIGDADDMSPDEIENMLAETGLKQALKGNYAFWKDINDRIHGKPSNNDSGPSVAVQVNINSDKEKYS